MEIIVQIKFLFYVLLSEFYKMKDNVKISNVI